MKRVAGTELVSADRLRAGDMIVCPAGDQFALLGATVDGDVVWLSSDVGLHGGAFRVRPSTKFVRVKRDRSIDTRPDLHRRAR